LPGHAEEYDVQSDDYVSLRAFGRHSGGHRFKTIWTAESTLPMRRAELENGTRFEAARSLRTQNNKRVGKTRLIGNAKNVRYCR
jgi:hypothetical protein